MVESRSVVPKCLVLLSHAVRRRTSHAHQWETRTVVQECTRVSCSVRLVVHKISSASPGLCPQGQSPVEEDNHDGHKSCELGDGVTFNAINIKRNTSEVAVLILTGSAKADHFRTNGWSPSPMLNLNSEQSLPYLYGTCSVFISAGNFKRLERLRRWTCKLR